MFSVLNEYYCIEIREILAAFSPNLAVISGSSLIWSL